MVSLAVVFSAMMVGAAVAMAVVVLLLRGSYVGKRLSTPFFVLSVALAIFALAQVVRNTCPDVVRGDISLRILGLAVSVFACSVLILYRRFTETGMERSDIVFLLCITISGLYSLASPGGVSFAYVDRIVLVDVGWWGPITVLRGPPDLALIPWTLCLLGFSLHLGLMAWQSRLRFDPLTLSLLILPPVAFTVPIVYGFGLGMSWWTGMPLGEYGMATVYCSLALVLYRREREMYGEMNQRRSQLEAVLEHGLGLSGLLDLKGRVVLANRTALSVAGVNAADVIGQRFIDTPWWSHSAEARQHLSEAISRAAAGSTIGFQTTHPRSDGTLVDVDFSLTPYRGPDGRIEYLIAEGRDISEVKRNQRLELRSRELEFITEQAESANRAKSVFLANMSHEIRTPLNAVLGYAQLMQRSPALSEEHRKAVQAINRSGEHLLQLINDILELSRIEAGRSTCASEDFDLHAMLDTLYSMFHRQADEKGLRFSIDRSSDLPRFIQTDQRKLRQILINLLSNAVKFTDRGQVELFASQTAGRLIITVRDTGPGISADERLQLFQPFYQVGNGQRTGKGTGLGLAISRGFAILLGGALTIESTVGEGSRFIVDIPVETAASQPIQRQQRRFAGLLPGQRTPRILVAEDHADSRNALFELLSLAGCTVEGCDDGAAAVAACRRIMPDLIWMDIDMPVLDGLAATAVIRSLPGPQPRIVALTAAAFNEDRSRMLAAGCNEVIRKPYRDEDLLELIERLLGVRFSWISPADGVDLPATLPRDECLARLSLVSQVERDRLRHALVIGEPESCTGILTSWNDRELVAALHLLVTTFSFELVLRYLEEIDGNTAAAHGSRNSPSAEPGAR